MSVRLGALTMALGLTLATGSMLPSATAAQDVQGRVLRLDPPANVLVLDDGRMYRVHPNTVVFVDNKPVPFATLQPGTVVSIRSGEMVTIRDGQYVTGVPVVVGPPVAGTPVVTATPAAAVKRTIYGKVTDVDKDGEVEIKTDKGSFEIQLTPDSVRYIKKGDTVVIDTTFAPPGTPVSR